MKANRVDVLVSGAGPVGLTAALCLLAEGRKTVVVDAKPRGVTHSYALALHPASLELLDNLGLAGDVIARALPVRTLAFYSGSRRIAAVPVAPPGAKFPFVAVIGQEVLEAVLGRALAQRGAAVRWNHRLARFTANRSGVGAAIDELEERVIGYAAARFDWMVRRTHELEVQFLIGADGHDSFVRRLLEIDFPEVRPAEHFAVFEFHRRDSGADELAVVLGPDGPSIFWPLPGGRGRWSFALRPQETPDAFREKDHEPVQIIGPGVFPALEPAMLGLLLAERAPWFGAGIGHVYWKMLVRFERRLAASFGRDRVWLAGDAAHLTGPAGVQSMNVGLREARELAQAIAAAADGGTADAPLLGYAASRGCEWRQLLGLSGGLVSTENTVPGIAAAKEQLLACLPGSGAALENLAEQLGLRLVT